MADSLIGGLTAVVTPADTDEYPVQQSGDTVAKRITRTQLLADHAADTTTHGISTFGATLVDDANAATARTTLGLGTAAVSATGDFEAAGSVATHAALASGVHGITAAAATVLDDVSTAAMLTTLGAQPSDAELTAIAGLTSAADKGIQFTGAGTAGVFDLTTAGKALLDDADASAQRTTLGLGTAATSNTGDFAAASHVHAGADITTGTVAAARLGTMTGDAGAGGASGAAPAPGAGDAAAGKFLKADATWAAPAGGIGGSTGATDNAILRADGTGGETLQASALTIDDTTGNLTAPGAFRISTAASNGGITLDPHGDGVITLAAGTIGIVASAPAGPAIKMGNFSIGRPVSNGTNFAITSTPYVSDQEFEIFYGASLSGKAAFRVPLLFPVLVEASTAGSGAPNILTAVESGTLLTNEGTTAANYHTLPTAVAGLQLEFVVQDVDGLRIVANTADTIRVMDKVTAAAGYVESTTIGSVVRLVAINATEWFATSIHGVWTDGTFTFSDVANTTP